MYIIWKSLEMCFLETNFHSGHLLFVAGMFLPPSSRLHCTADLVQPFQAKDLMSVFLAHPPLPQHPSACALHIRSVIKPSTHGFRTQPYGAASGLLQERLGFSHNLMNLSQKRGCLWWCHKTGIFTAICGALWNVVCHACLRKLCRIKQWTKNLKCNQHNICFCAKKLLVFPSKNKKSTGK